ncbi:MAG: MFS transporter [Solirubrobacteraceae bacterium]|nr:MFS transporter [Solirubrobacteraceae bacterium]
MTATAPTRSTLPIAIATMFTGLTVANVLGVPLGTLLGQQLGWRATFWAITAIGVVALAALALLLPRAADRRPEGADLRAEVGAFASGQVWASMAITVFGFGGLFGAFTYMAFTLTDVSGFPDGAVPWLLVLFGIGMFAGNLLGGRAADRSIHRSLVGGLTALAALLALFALTAGSPVAAVAAMLLLGAAGFLPAPAYQMRIMARAGRAPTLASGANIAAFNVGNALGAWLGGLTIDADLGYTGPIWAGAAMTVVALGIVFVADRRLAACPACAAGAEAG